MSTRKSLDIATQRRVRAAMLAIGRAAAGDPGANRDMYKVYLAIVSEKRDPDGGIGGYVLDYYPEELLPVRGSHLGGKILGVFTTRELAQAAVTAHLNWFAFRYHLRHGKRNAVDYLYRSVITDPDPAEQVANDAPRH